MILELHKYPDLAAFHWDEIVSRSNQILGDIIRRGIASGEFRRTDPHAAVQMIKALILMHVLVDRPAGTGARRVRPCAGIRPRQRHRFRPPRAAGDAASRSTGLRSTSRMNPNTPMKQFPMAARARTSARSSARTFAAAIAVALAARAASAQEPVVLTLGGAARLAGGPERGARGGARAAQADARIRQAKSAFLPNSPATSSRASARSTARASASTSPIRSPARRSSIRTAS